MRKSLLAFLASIALLSAIMIATTPWLIKHTRIGLEFRGGYEIVFVSEPIPPNTTVTRDEIVTAANVIAKRANGLGVSEPKIGIEGQSIRLQLAGISDVTSLRATLLAPAGLPVHLRERYSQTVGGVLGEADFAATMQAGAIALGLIFLFLVSVYRVPGLIAAFTLLTYLWLLLVVFNAIGATLSLAAIVAFLLGVGIAADANILSFERIKEKLRAGLPSTQAVREGESSSLRTILDANTTVLICVVVLFIAGVGPVRGFALTTALGIIISVVTNVFLARFLIGQLYEPHNAASPGLFAVRVGSRRPPFDFLRSRTISLVAALVVAGLSIWAVFTSEINYDIDFKAGTALDVQLPHATDQDKSTEVIAGAGTPAATVAVGGAQANQVAARFDDVLTAAQINGVVNAFKKAYGPGVAFQENTADPIVAEQLRTEAIASIGFAILATLVFLTIRFDWRFAVAGMIATLSAVLFVLGAFAFFHLEIDVTFIAAILTVIGFTLNEAVPILSRIRENIQAEVSPGAESFAEIVNVSVGQVLVRSLYTVLMVIIGSVCLYQFGAEPLHMFSLAILLGLIYGTLASLLIAPQLWYLLAGKEGRVSSRSSSPVTDG